MDIAGNILDQYESMVIPDQNFAQILIYADSNKALIKAQEIIRKFEIQIINSKSYSSNIVLLVLDTRDVRDVVLKLTENGFLNIRGYNASHLQSNL